MTTKLEIEAWFNEGVRQGATHMIVVCDTFDHEDYPIYTTGAKHTREQYAAHNGVNMQRVMEVYDLSAGKAAQLAEGWAMHMPPDEGSDLIQTTFGGV